MLTETGERDCQVRILLVSNNYPLSATTSTWAPFCIRDLALALVRAGAEVMVAAPDHAGEQEVDPGVTVKRIPWSGREEMDLISLKMNTATGLRHAASLFMNGRKHVKNIARQFHPDFCLAAWALPSGEFARHVKKGFGIPYGVWCLGSDIHTWGRKPIFRGLTRRVLVDADLRYADGFALAREAEALCGLPCDFLATTRPLDSKSGPGFSFPSGRKHFLFVGRWEPVKGLDVLLAAWRKLASAGVLEGAQLHVVGQGQGLQQLVDDAAKAEALVDSLDVRGWVPLERLAELYAATDFVVIPSRNESIPVVFSEALSNGKPLVVSDVGDMGELVAKYELGRVVPAESVPALAEALAEFIKDGHTFDSEKLSEVTGLFDIDATARQLLSDIRSVISDETIESGSKDIVADTP